VAANTAFVQSPALPFKWFWLSRWLDFKCPIIGLTAALRFIHFHNAFVARLGIFSTIMHLRFFFYAVDSITHITIRLCILPLVMQCAACSCTVVSIFTCFKAWRLRALVSIATLSISSSTSSSFSLKVYLR